MTIYGHLSNIKLLEIKLHLFTEQSLYSKDIIEVQFNLDLDEERERLSFLEAFCRTHQIYHSLSDEYYDEDMNLSVRFMINRTYKVYDSANNQHSIDVKPELLVQLDKLIEDLISQANNSLSATIYRFRSLDLKGFTEIYAKIVEHLDNRFHLKLLGSNYDFVTATEPHIFEIQFLDQNDLIKLKLTYSTLAAAFEVEDHNR